MKGFDKAQAAYDAMLPPEYYEDDFDGYCDECCRDDDEHDEDCENFGTTAKERAEEMAIAYAESKAEAQYEAMKERDYFND